MCITKKRYFSRFCIKCGNKFDRLGKRQKLCLDCMHPICKRTFLTKLKNEKQLEESKSQLEICLIP